MIKGRAIKYGDDINTDEIIPAKFLYSRDTDELASHCFEGLDPDFAKKARKGDIIVAGKNFGCGSSREHAPVAIKGAGISCVIAKSFARIFFRNAINIGLPIIESARAAEMIQPGDELEVDLVGGKIENKTRSESYDMVSFPAFMREIIEAGGLINRIRNPKGGL
jgi:3-isopropylmalate/(R)-2-methylmalate dehydratase small subunit